MSTTAKPEVLRFSARLVELPKTGKLAVEVPAEIAAKIGKMEKVEGMINGQVFRAPVVTDKSGDCFIKTNQSMLRGAAAGAEDEVEMVILGPEAEPEIPEDLQAAFDSTKNAELTWDSLTHMGKLDWIRWIDDTNNPETRARRIRRTAEQLAEGKRRACCVNVYAYMLMRVAETER